MERIVIVGGGIGGLVLAVHLTRRMRHHGGVDIRLVDRNDAHVWKPMLHRFAAGTARAGENSFPFYAQARRHGFRYRPGTLAGIDRAAKTVDIGPVPLPDGQSDVPARTFPYDRLVIAIGSRANDFGTEGVAEHCRFIDDIGEADRFNDLLRSRTFEAVDAHRNLPIVIVGGGATGVELAAELRRQMDILGQYTGGPTPSRLDITLVESGDRLLAAFPPALSQEIEATLKSLRITVRTGTKVVGVDAGGIMIEGDERIPAALSVWAAGVKAPEATRDLGGLEMNRRGQLLVGPTLQTVSDPAIYAIGDCASPAGGDRWPTTAQVAREQAIFLANSLAATLRHKQPPREFRYTDRGSLVSLGDYAAYGTLGHYGFFKGGYIRGRMAELAHAALYRMHQMDLNGVIGGGFGWIANDLQRAVTPKVRLS